MSKDKVVQVEQVNARTTVVATLVIFVAQSTDVVIIMKYAYPVVNVVHTGPIYVRIM